MAYITLKSIYADVFYIPGKDFPSTLTNVDYKKLLASNCIEEIKPPTRPATVQKSSPIKDKEKTKINVNVNQGEN